MSLISESVRAIASNDQGIGWLMAIVAVWTVAIGFILLSLTLLVPPLWSAGLAKMRELLPRRGRVINFDDRRRAALRRAMGGR